MKKFFTIGEAAKLVGMTAETLRHYDRIGLISPHKTDEWTKYRYYTEEEIVRLNTVRALRCMDLPLEDIKRVLQLNDVDEIVEFLEKTEQRAEDKIAELQSVKVRIGRAKKFYEGKRAEALHDAPRIRDLPQRVILLSDALSEPTVENLWNYHRHFFAQVGEARKGQFAFEDLAGVYEAEGRRRMFAVCTRYAPDGDLRILPAGKYLCAECTEQTRAEVRRELLARAEERGFPAPQFLVEVVVLTGILQWKYEMQILMNECSAAPAHTDETSVDFCFAHAGRVILRFRATYFLYQKTAGQKSPAVFWRRRRDYLRAVPLMASSAGKVSVPFLLRTSPPSRANSCLIHDFERLVSCASAKKGAPKCSLALAQKTRFELVLPVKVLLP